MKSEKVAELDPPEPNYEENQTLEPGVEKVVKQPVNGSRWVTNLVKEKDGKVVSDELFHKSTYKGKAATIQRNISGVVVPPSDAAEKIPLLHKRYRRAVQCLRQRAAVLLRDQEKHRFPRDLERHRHHQQNPQQYQKQKKQKKSDLDQDRLIHTRFPEAEAAAGKQTIRICEKERRGKKSDAEFVS